MMITGYVVTAIFVMCCGVGIISLLWSLYHSIRLIFQFSDPGNAFSRRTLWNPMNAIFNPVLLNPEGLNSRRKVLCGFLIFAISFLGAGGIAVVLKLIHIFILLI